MPSANLWIPAHLKPARKHIKVVFYVNKQLDRVEVGAPEQFPLPPVLASMGWEKVVCETAHEVERYSKKKREQDQRDKEMTDEERERFEGPIRARIRADLFARSKNPNVSQIARDFCVAALQRMDQEEAWKKQEKIESFMHVEAFTDGK